MDRRLTAGSLKLLLGKKCLDWAEKLPRFRGGTPAELQDIREHQRSESEKDHSRTRPPHGAGLELLYIRLVEMYHLEDFPSFHDRILQLFPNLDDPFRGRSFSAQFARHGGAMFGGGWYSLGDIVREKAGKFFLATSTTADFLVDKPNGRMYHSWHQGA